MNATAVPYTTADARPSAVSGASANATASGTATRNASWWLRPRKRGRISAGTSTADSGACIGGKEKGAPGDAPWSLRPAGSLRGADDGDVLPLRALGAPLGLELDLRALGERLEAVAADRRVVDEDVLAAVARGDEAVALRVVEPLHSSCCHRNPPPPAYFENGQRRRTVRFRYSLM